MPNFSFCQVFRRDRSQKHAPLKPLPTSGNDLCTPATDSVAKNTLPRSRPGRGTVFRVSALDPQTTVDELNAALTVEFASETDGIAVDTSRTTISPSCYGSKSQTALIQFTNTIPVALEAIDHNRSYPLRVGNAEVDIDKHFYGLTPLYPTSGKIVVE